MDQFHLSLAYDPTICYNVNRQSGKQTVGKALKTVLSYSLHPEEIKLLSLGYLCKQSLPFFSFLHICTCLEIYIKQDIYGLGHELHFVQADVWPSSAKN